MHPGVQRCKLFDPSLVKLELLGLPFPSLLWRSGSRRSTCSCCHACSPMVSGSHADRNRNTKCLLELRKRRFSRRLWLAIFCNGRRTPAMRLPSAESVAAAQQQQQQCSTMLAAMPAAHRRYHGKTGQYIITVQPAAPPYKL